MPEQDVDEAMAAALGLQKAWALNPDQVRKALVDVQRWRGAFARTRDAAAEPDPAYRVPADHVAKAAGR